MKNMKRVVGLAAAVFCYALSADAQLPAMQNGVERGKPELVAPTEEIPTVDEMMERMRHVERMRDGFVTGDVVLTNAETVRRGDVIASVSVRPARVGRLDNDLMRGNAVQDLLSSGPIDRGTVVLPAGTPVYHTTMQYDIMYGGMTTNSLRYDAWCGVAQSTSGQSAYCALSNGQSYRVAEPRPSPYMPTTMTDPVIASAFSVTEDPEVARELPQLELVYTFMEFDETDLDVRRSLRVNGSDVRGAQTMNVSLRRDGSALLPIAGGHVRVIGSRAASVEQVAPDTAAQEARLRQLAERMVADMRARAAANSSARVEQSNE
ncbi:MAG: hypothetical protein JNL81_10880 [Hyphomonadaceae bacterium]|nr:hypothetical protein [Hyphomonadaceae bacterium]